MALGVGPRTLARQPLLLASQVALLGIPAGFAANAWLRSVIQSFFPLPVLKTPMNIGVFIQGAALGLAVSLLATVIPLRRALAVTPVEAISVGARAAKSSGLAWITRQRLTVDLAAPQPAGAASLRAVADTPVIGIEQRSLRLLSALAAHRRRLGAFSRSSPHAVRSGILPSAWAAYRASVQGW
jgi:hypothetical protein